MIPHTMAGASSSFLLDIVNPALRSLALGTIAALLLWALRVKNASARLIVWTGVLYAALAMPMLALAIPSLRVPLPAVVTSVFARSFSTTPNGVVEASVTPRAALAQKSKASNDLSARMAPVVALAPEEDWFTASVPGQEHSSRHTVLHDTTVPQDATVPYDATASTLAALPIYDSAPPRVPAAAPRRASGPLPWLAIATVIFCVVALFMIARIALGAIFGHRLVRAAETIADRDSIGVLVRQARAAGVASAPRLAESDVVSVPVTLGVLRPVILLPSYWRSWDERTLDAVIAHEMSHVARRDALTQRLALLHRAIFWFSPLAWWLNRALANAAEEASDEAALEAVADRAFYAETVIEFFAALAENPRRVYWQGVSMAAPGQAERRVDRILAWKGAVSMRIRKSFAVGLAVVGIPVVLLTAAARPSAKAQQAPPAPAVPAVPVAPIAPQTPSTPLTPETPAVPITALMPPAPPKPMLAPTPAVAPVAPAMATPEVPPVPAAPETPWTPEVAPAAPAPPAPLARADASRSLRVYTYTGKQPLVANNGKALFALKGMIDMSNQLDVATPLDVQVDPQTEQKIQELQQKLKDLQARYTSNHPDVLELQKELAQTMAQLDAQVKQVMPVEPMMPAQTFKFQFSPVGNITFGDFGSRFVIVSGDSPIVSSGDSEDVEHATALRSKINGDFIWFQHDEKSYVIRDQALVNQAKGYFKDEQALGTQQQDLGKQQRALGDQQRALGDKMRDVKVTIPDISPDMQKLEAQIKQLSASGGTEQQLGDLQRQLGELMRKLGQNQQQVGDQQRQVGSQMRQLGDQQRTLGDQQRQLGDQQRDASEKARTQMKQLLDDAVAKGTAQPE
jgi:beta-lactamase regulating signal transducer with metallopeptidase domain